MGKRHFTYTLRQGESLSVVAQRFLGDVFEFYGLARYNDIAVPRDVHAGQVIKVPGEAPPEPPPRPRPAKREPVRAEEATPPPPPPPAPAPPQPAEQATPTQVAYENGMKLLRTGRKDEALAAFQQAVKLDPDNASARAQMERVRQDLVQRHSRLALGAFHRQDMVTAIKEWDKVLKLDPTNESARLKRQQAVELQERIKQFPAKQ
jgi:LysM repeat protein